MLIAITSRLEREREGVGSLRCYPSTKHCLSAGREGEEEEEGEGSCKTTFEFAQDYNLDRGFRSPH